MSKFAIVVPLVFLCSLIQTLTTYNNALLANIDMLGVSQELKFVVLAQRRGESQRWGRKLGRGCRGKRGWGKTSDKYSSKMSHREASINLVVPFYSMKQELKICRTCTKKRRESKVGEAPRLRKRTITTSARPRRIVSRMGRKVEAWLQSRQI